MEQSQIDKLAKGLGLLREMSPWSDQKAALIVEELDVVFWKSLDKQQFGQLYCDFRGPELMISMLTQFEKDGLFKVKGAWETAFVVYNTLCNISESCGDVSAALGAKGLLTLCLQNLIKYREKSSLKDVESLLRISLGILCNMAIVPANRHLFREEGFEEKMQPYMTGADPFLKTLCMIILAYIVEEGQEENLGEKAGETTEYLVKILKEARKSPNNRYKGLCDIEIAQALGRLAVHDQNKRKIMDFEGLPILVKMLHDKSTDTQDAAANTLWNLAFSEDVRKKLEEDANCLETLRKLSKSSALNVRDSASGALWVITKEKAKESEETKEKSVQTSHIMISYQWGSQRMVLKIRDALKAAGYKVWVDVDHMSGSTLQAMAEAVEGAYIVLMCISERYKESPNCRTEAEYAFQLRKSIIPLMMEEYYHPDGWLGMILGAKLYMDFSGRLNIEEEITKLHKEVENQADTATAKGKPEGDAANGSTGKIASKNVSFEASQLKSYNWTREQFKEWLTNNDLHKWRPALLKYDGKLLHNLYRLRQEAPEFFYSSVQSDEGISKLIDIFKFTAALDALMNE